MDFLTALAAWADAHHALMLGLLWPFIMGLFTLICRPRSPEAYAAIAVHFPRLATFLQLVAALGIDPKAFVDALKPTKNQGDK